MICIRLLKIHMQKLEESVVPYIPLGHAIGRIGCLLAGCCHGFEYSGAFAVKNILFLEGGTCFPIQAVEALLNIPIMAVLLLYSKKERPKYSILSLYLLMYSVMRFFTEFFRGDEIRGGFWLLSTSQWISIALFTVCIPIFCIPKLRKIRS